MTIEIAASHQEGTNIHTRILGGQWRHKITIYGNGLSVYIHIWQIRDVTNRQLFTWGYYIMITIIQVSWKWLTVGDEFRVFTDNFDLLSDVLDKFPHFTTLLVRILDDLHALNEWLTPGWSILKIILSNISFQFM